MSEPSITTLFEEALNLPVGERAAFVDAACGGSPEVRRQLHRLLAHADDAPTLFRRIAAGIAVPACPEDRIGERVGAYQLDECIGEGGMGVVYLAHRADGAFDQRVAVKLVKAALGSEARRVLFLRERQILARLDHPYIARLFDGGVTAEGAQYFVMEHVVGKPLTDFANDRALPRGARLQLFLKVCDAVADAHRHMVVHQDLKPANILVTADGSPKLLDFGIAGQLADDADGGGEVGTVARGTAGYASPEQRRGEPAAAATDIYALGVVLRALTENAASTHREKDDVDWICARATAEQPTHRYATVDELTDDLHRYLSYRCVRARPASIGYSLARFVRRNRVGVAAASIVAVILVLYGADAIARANETAMQRDRAELERNASHRVNTFLTQALDKQDEARDDTDGAPLRQTLDHGVMRLESELPDDGELRGVILRNVAEVYERLGFPDRAITTLQRSIDVLSAAKGMDHPSVAGSWHALGRLYGRHGCFAQARSALGRALAIQGAQLHDDDPDLTRTRLEIDRVAALAAGHPLPLPPTDAHGTPAGPPPRARPPLRGRPGERGPEGSPPPLANPSLCQAQPAPPPGG